MFFRPFFLFFFLNKVQVVSGHIVNSSVASGMFFPTGSFSLPGLGFMKVLQVGFAAAVPGVDASARGAVCPAHAAAGSVVSRESGGWPPGHCSVFRSGTATLSLPECSSSLDVFLEPAL